LTAFGVQGSGPLVGGAPEPEHYRRIAETAEAAGFDSLWAGDHVAFHEPLLDITIALATFAAVTERIRLGAGVLLLPLRAPALVAREFGSLDYVSGGRVILGVGTGGEHAADFEAVGVPVRERGRRTDESMRALRGLFAREAPAPVQPNGPPLWVGGRSDAAIRRAKHLGDGWMPIWVSPERYAEGLAKLGREHTAAVVLPALVGGTVEEARLYLSRRYATEFSTHAIERYCVVGSPEECAERSAEYVAAGAEHVVFHPAVEPHRLQEQVELLAEVVHVAAR
jgi:alkanesulfonate monooxygenase SsuD/methylene tetrahydromethanopterin reductase-like flavin-dependent oxidoreductase (luciferase family)